MRIAMNLAAILAVGFLAACNSEETCTQELATKKATEMRELAATDPAKLAELAPKVLELSTKAAAGGDDLQATCKAIDDLMAELAK